MRAKIFFYVLLIITGILTGTFLAIMDTSRVEAWTGNLQSCDATTGNPFSEKFFASGETLRDFISDFANTSPYDEFDSNNSNHSMVVTGSGGSTVTVVYETGSTNTNTQNIVFDEQNNGNRRIKFPDDTRQRVIQYDANDDVLVAVGSWTAINNSYNASNFTCISYNTNVEYSGDYGGTIYDGVFDPTAECNGITDITCQLDTLFNNVANTFLAVGRAIIQGVAQLFIPNSDVMATIFAQMRTNFEDSLGLLFYPVGFLIDFFTTLRDTPPCGTSCTLFTTTWLGGTLTVNPLIFRDFIPTYYSLVLNIIRAVTVYGVLLAIYRKYMEVVRG